MKQDILIHSIQEREQQIIEEFIDYIIENI